MNTVAVAEPESAALLLRHDQAGIATLTLNRPRQYNALSQALLAALQTELDRIATDSSIKAVILAAAGSAFCPGHDLKEIRSSEDRAFHQAMFQQCSHMMLSLNRLPQPVIAQVNGIATAAGCQLVAACDLAVASDSAQFAVSGINLGLFCSTPAVALSRNLSRKRALGMLLSGDFIDAQTALDYGLINEVVAADELAAATRRWAEKVCAKPAVSIALGKKLFYQQLELSLEAAYALAGERMACNMETAEAREGIDAFLEKRQPCWD